MLNGASYNDPRKFLQTHEYKNLTRWTKEIGERPAVKRGRMVNRTSGPPEEQLHERHDASDFETNAGQDRSPRVTRDRYRATEKQARNTRARRTPAEDGGRLRCAERGTKGGQS